MQLEKLLRDAGYEYAVINGGSSGDTSAWLVSRVDRVTQDAQPGDIALIVIGANDGMRSLSIDQLADNLTTLITTLQDRDITIVLGGMQVPTNLDPVYRESFAWLYPTIASETDVELLPFFLQDVAAVPELNLADGIHPNSTWYAIIAQNMMDTLIQAQIVSQ
jgi:acyl-CoA thioesterase-1